MINKYLKLRTIRILREKHLDNWTCIEVLYIWLGKANWYRDEVRKYAELNNVLGNQKKIPMQNLAYQNGTTVRQERLKFLNYLERLVKQGKA